MRIDRAFFTPDKIEEIKRGYLAGHSLAMIADELQCHKTTIFRRVKGLQASGELPLEQPAKPVKAVPPPKPVKVLKKFLPKLTAEQRRLAAMLERDAAFVAALRENERLPAEQNVKTSSVVRMMIPSPQMSSEGSPAAWSSES